jgi:poly-gamma-glutamate capsule biosynthesis protein CapA/YwtB (metallophosphatase superfamily)
MVGGVFDFVSLANNHVMDHGIAPLLATRDQLERRATACAGAGRDLEEAWQPAIAERDGMRLAVIAATCSVPPGFAAAARTPGVATIHVTTSYTPNPRWADHPGAPPLIHTTLAAADVAMLRSTIARAASQVDHVIVSLHWGLPGERRVLDYQSELGHIAIDAGASVVVGHHAHVLQPVERYQQGLIFYGLSHFVFDYPDLTSGKYQFAATLESAAASITFSKGKIASAALVPLICDEHVGPRCATRDHVDNHLDQLAAASRELGAELVWDEERGEIAIS